MSMPPTPIDTPTDRGACEYYEFPRGYLFWPRMSWNTVPFVHPPYLPGDILFKSQWAGREASKRWINVMETQDLGLIDQVDLAVAVLNKVSQLWVLCFEHRTAS